MEKSIISKTEAKNKAQDLLMQAMQVAYHYLEDPDLEDKEAIRAVIDVQFERVEELFGYDVGSWGKGV